MHRDFKERLISSSKVRGSKLILALDLYCDLNDRLKLAEKIFYETKEYIAALKINFHLILPFGLIGLSSLLKLCADEDIPIIADMKLNDISSTNIEVIGLLRRYGIDAVIANPVVGFKDGLGDSIRRMHELGGGIILLIYMSHEGAKDVFGLKLSSGERLYMYLARRAVKWGADGIIVSAKEVTKLREIRGLSRELLILSPGIGKQGGDATKALEFGADFIIVGRSITESRDPGGLARHYRELAAST